MEEKNEIMRETPPCEELYGEKNSLFNHGNQVYSILHIDDDEPTLQLSKLFIETLSPNLNIISEPDSTKINSWMDNDVACYLVDYSMPLANGLSVCKKIREIKNTPIILFTSKEPDEIPFEDLENMNVTYHQKNSDPCNYNKLTEAILELINNDLINRSIRFSENR
jgi:DNA-binding response OmpR family regulator